MLALPPPPHPVATSADPRTPADGNSLMDVRFAAGPLGITSTNSTVLARLDSIIVTNGPGGPWQCPIDEIHPVDVRRMRADERAHTTQPAARR